MKYFKPHGRKFIISLVLTIELLTSCAIAKSEDQPTEGKILLKFEQPASQSAKKWQQIFIEAAKLNKLVDEINQVITPKNDINLVFRSDQNNTGPYFDRKTNSIYFSYEFAATQFDAAIKNIQEFNQKTKTTEFRFSEQEMSQQASDDVIYFNTYVLLHELAHALITANNLPIVGEEEDAADNFAALMILKLFPKKEAHNIIVVSTTSVSYLQSKNMDLAAAADYHGSSLNRNINIRCLEIGKYPELLTQMIKTKADFPEFQQYIAKHITIKQCKNMLAEQERMWEQLLQPNGKEKTESHNGKLRFIIEPPTNPQHKYFYEYIQNETQPTASFSEFSTKFNNKIPLKKDLTVIFSDKPNNADMHFNFQNNTLIVPYQWFDRTIDIFVSERPVNKEIKDFYAKNSLYFILLTNIAKAIIDINQLPVVGGKELAAEQLGAILTLNFIPDGVKRTLLGQDLMELTYQANARTNPSQNLFEHNKVGMATYKRMTGIICLAYGKSAEQAGEILKVMVNPETQKYFKNKATTCKGDYAYMSKIWFNLLKNY